MPTSAQRDYGREYFDTTVAGMAGYVGEGCPSKMPVIDCVMKALLDRRPRIRYSPKAFNEHVMSFVMTHFPHEISDYIYN